ncbi:MAG TPA: hypothetical protein PKM63_18870 [Panacibacter sp.]|nr:hypothetical protein [Panacibacter sp.]HNP46365.1 hypothetical protein [Panacibacter sp.]
MKKITLFTFAIALSLATLAQTTTKDMTSKLWRFTMPVALKECDEFGNLLQFPNKIDKAKMEEHNDTAARNYEFRISNVVGDKVIIYFVRWSEGVNQKSGGTSEKDIQLEKIRAANVALNENLVKKPGETSFPTDPSKYRKFVMTRDEFDKNCEEKVPKNQLSIGAVTLPIKVRFANGLEGNDKVYSSFEGNVSVGLSAGLKRNYRNGKYSTIALGGIALSSIPVDSTTTKNFVAGKTNASAVTIHAGFLFSIDNFQIGIFTGIDYLSGEINSKWDYRNKPWVGVGIGFSFFNAKKTTDTQP